MIAMAVVRCRQRSSFFVSTTSMAMLFLRFRDEVCSAADSMSSVPVDPTFGRCVCVGEAAKDLPLATISRRVGAMMSEPLDVSE